MSPEEDETTGSSDVPTAVDGRSVATVPAAAQPAPGLRDGGAVDSLEVTGDVNHTLDVVESLGPDIEADNERDSARNTVEVSDAIPEPVPAEVAPALPAAGDARSDRQTDEVFVIEDCFREARAAALRGKISDAMQQAVRDYVEKKNAAADAANAAFWLVR